MAQETLTLPSGKEALTGRIITIRDEMESYCKPFWERIKFARAVYNNENPHTRDAGGMGQVKHFLRGKSLYNQAAITIDAVTPWLSQGMPRAQLLADVSQPELSPTIDLNELIEITQRWLDMYEEVDGEGDLHAQASQNVCVDGVSIRKGGWSRTQDRLIAPIISALSFLIDPGCSRPDLLDANYCGQHDMQSTVAIKMKHPDMKLKNKDMHRVDEIWIREHVAKDFLKLRAKRMVYAVLIDDQLAPGFPRHTPFAYPDFPYVCWRNFMFANDDLKPAHFWGIGYAEKLWRQQKVLDLSIADFMLQLGNVTSGKLLSTDGAIKQEEHLLPRHGLVIELEEGFNPLTDVKELPPEQINTVLFQWITWLVDAMQKTTGTGEVFTGQ